MMFTFTVTHATVNKEYLCTTKSRYVFIFLFAIFILYSHKKKVYETLQKMLKAKLKGFSGTEEQDITQFTTLTGNAPAASYSSGSCNTAASYHLSLSLWHKISQKNILRQSILLVQKELSSLLPESQLGVQVYTFFFCFCSNFYFISTACYRVLAR